MAKKQKTTERLNLDDKIIATSVFLFESLKMDKTLSWDLKIRVQTRLSQSFREYTVKLSLNEEPFRMRISDLEKSRQQVESENQLFEGQRKTQLKNIDTEIKEIEKELEEAKENTEEIEFAGVINKLEYKDSDTILNMWIPKDIANKFNDVSNVLKNYKIELIRE